MNSAVILLGGNLGDRHSNIAKALSLIEVNAGSVIKKSRVYETEPWGFSDQPEYLNQVVEIKTNFSAEKLLNILLQTENQMGRKRNEKWSPRIIDLDILYFNDEIISTEVITVPHQHMHERRFVLEPLTEILPEMIHPVLKKRNRELLQTLKDDLLVRPLNS
jgi:2-amino-4-hydroxy-6-hydroxymethyldihydropteridine diphosphokinase